MELLSQVPLIGPTLATLLPFLVVLSIVVFVHEYGHYIVARWCGIGAEVFSIGFGKELYGWTDRRGTRWRIAALPLGGYVKFLGDSDASSSHRDDAALAALTPEQRQHSFHDAPLGRRALTVAAGPGFNFLMTIAIFALVAMWQGAPARGPVIGSIADDMNPGFAEMVDPGDRIVALDGQPVADFEALLRGLLASEGREVEARILRADGGEETVPLRFLPPARVDGLSPGGAAERAGLRPGDVVRAVDGRPIDHFAALQRATEVSGGAPMDLEIERGGEILSVTLTPDRLDPADPSSRPLLGIHKQSNEIAAAIDSVGPVGAVGFGVARTWDIIVLSLSGIGEVITGRQEAREVLGGPIRIAEISGQAATAGIGTFIGLIAVLSTSIGLINLFPIPILDGGHLMFYAIEKLRGAPLEERWQEIGNRIGLALVLMLMIFATVNDIARL